MRLRALVIDDEELARKRLRKMLQKYDGEIDVVGEARNGEEAVERIESFLPDLVFLDVQMPAFDGFEVARRMRHKPLIVFATAYDEYALKAFEENSIDYLLKPIEQVRLDKAIEKLRRIFSTTGVQMDKNVERLLSHLASPPLKRLQVKSGEKIVFIDLDEVVFFEAKDKYTFLHTANAEHIIDLTLA
jgi:two-component system LytT family response regulator